ncbi:iron-containing alcohol dehydrogenase [Natronohydrobacter thiooxidans]|uniref:iron-containing alcohol dehydrogenase n=1 Tax=Natronohydrobacter thiooxidans TaxID=87172 RepID=UPI0008FF32AE|nr:iron-containing alcohol dehydrogenase [Natronohydrobacter thiooxidans]
MTPFAFATASTIRFGRGAFRDLPGHAAGQGKRVLLLRSASVGQAEDLACALRKTGAVLELTARGEPDLPAIEANLALARPFAPDLVIALGGGAVIDHGKALAALIPAPHGALRYLEVVGEGQPLDAPPLPLIAIPTTAGTGAEATRNAVIQVPQARRKVSLRDPRLYPTLALVDPELCLSCPKPVILASGLDAITQVIEPFICACANPLTDALCREAIPRGLSALRRLMDQGDTGAWDDMALTSLCGGIALANAGLGAVHGFAGVIGGQTGAAHGAICGALLAPVLLANQRATAPDSPARARITWVLDQISAEYGSLTEFRDWSAGHGLPRLAALGVAPEDHAALAQEARLSSSYKANPVDLPLSDLIGILQSA